MGAETLHLHHQFHHGGAVKCIFRTDLTNKKSDPRGELLKMIEKSFVSFDKFKGYIAESARNIDGNGWGIPAYQPYLRSLTIMQCENNEKLQQWGAVPILEIDVREHAYYPKCKNKRQDFVNTLFNIINRDNVAERLSKARQLS